MLRNEVTFEDKAQRKIIKVFCAKHKCSLKAFVRLLKSLGSTIPVRIRGVKKDGENIVFRNECNETITVPMDDISWIEVKQSDGLTSIYFVAKFSNNEVLLDDWY